MKKVSIAINGFGRIGRAAFKAVQNIPGAEIVAINDLVPVDTLAHLLKYDTVHGTYPGRIDTDGTNLIVDDVNYPVYAEKDPSQLPWNELKIDVVIECTGFFTTTEKASAHVAAGARAVVISAPPKDTQTPILVRGVADQVNQAVVSNASCTTNCIAPVMQVMHDSFGVAKSLLTTIHAYTSTQSLVDGPHKDLRRARAAAQNIIPTSTGAAVATAAVIPELEGVFDGMAVRVPVPDGSLSDIVLVTKQIVTVEQVNEAFIEAAAAEQYQGILQVTQEPIVSSDIIGNPASAIVDLSLTKVVGGDLVKIIAWYDNEWAYANRLIELACRAV